MAQVYKDIIRLTIDLKTGVKEAIAPIKQADNLSRVLRCQLINNGKPINLKGSQLLLYVVKADYKQCAINGVINESKTGIVDFELTEQSLILAEEIQCEIVKIDEGDVLLSFPIFKIGIDGALYDSELVESTNEFSALTALISNVASWENRFVGECERIEKEFDGKINEVNTQLSIESKRIDGFVALGEGSTTGDAELIDGRIDSSGVVHPNIGGCIRSEGDKINGILGVSIKYGDNAIDDSEFKDKVFNEEFVNKFNSENNIYFTVYPSFAIDNNTQLTTQLYFTDGTVITGNSSNIVEYYKGEKKLTYYGLGGVTQSSYPVTGVTKIKIILAGDNSKYYGRTVQGISMKLTKITGYAEFKKEYVSSFKEEVINLVKNEPTSKLPDYYTDYLTAKVDELKNIEESVGENGDSFVFITDYHSPSNQGHSPKLIKHICDELNIPQVVFGGDILTEVYDNSSTTQLRDFMKLFKDQQRFRVIVGNHDTNPYGGEGNKVSDSQLYSILVKRNEIDCNTNKKLYYSYDNVSQKIRYIFLNSSDTFTLGTEQETFLTEQITSVTNEWTIIIFVHAFYRFIAIDDRTCSKTFACGTKILNIVDNTNDGGKVACIFTGDSHIDQAKKYDKGYWVIGVTCDANGGQASSGSTDERQTGTVNEQAFDVVFVDTKIKKIICKRVGGGIGDREFIYN